jgi:SPP1 family predicted phage head-tail adaptor
MLQSGKLRHRVAIQKPVESQDSVTGEITTTWRDVYSEVPCSIEPLSVKDFLQSANVQSEVTVRVQFRYLSNLNKKMRLLGLNGVHKDKVFNPAGFLADTVSGQEYITAPCSEGVNEGNQ